MTRHDRLYRDITEWVRQERKDILLDSNNGYTVSTYGLSCSISWYVRNKCKNMRGLPETITLFRKAQIVKGHTIFTDMKGVRWHKVARKGWVQIEAKRKLSHASILKNRYRRGLITIPRNIAKIEAEIAESAIELPIVDTEGRRLDAVLTARQAAFEAKYNIQLKYYPYHQSVTAYAGKVPSHVFFELKEEFWQMRKMAARREDLYARERKIKREINTASSRISALKVEAAKLTHGADPKKKLAWEK